MEILVTEIATLGVVIPAELAKVNGRSHIQRKKEGSKKVLECC
jgi:hypothetical protein